MWGERNNFQVHYSFVLILHLSYCNTSYFKNLFTFFLYFFKVSRFLFIKNRNYSNKIWTFCFFAYTSCIINLLIGWLVIFGWLVDWLLFWLINWMIDFFSLDLFLVGCARVNKYTWLAGSTATWTVMLYSSRTILDGFQPHLIVL